MDLPYAQTCAARLITWLAPYCERIELAGSIRRGRPQCGDVDLVAIPKWDVSGDLLGAETDRRNRCADEIYRRVKAGGWVLDKAGPTYLVFTSKGVQVDVWFTDHDCFGTVLLCRTGSKEHNILLAKRARDLGGHWDPHHGVRLAGKHTRATTESDVYAALDLPYIAPEAREGDHVARVIAAAR